MKMSGQRRRYDAGDKVGYVKAIIDFALEMEDLRAEIERYLQEIGKGGGRKLNEIHR